MDLETFRLYASKMAGDALLGLCIETKKELLAANLRIEEMGNVSAMMAKEYKNVEKQLAQAKEEIRNLKAMLSHSQDKNLLRSRDMFGPSSEKLSGLECTGECSDPLDEDADCGSTGAENAAGKNRVISFRKKASPERKKRRTRGELFEDLTIVDRYHIDIEGLNREYGEYGWGICGWEHRSVVKHVRSYDYVVRIHTPVISYREDGFSALKHIPCDSSEIVWEKSYATASLVADILYSKAVLHLPFDRQEQDRCRQGFSLSKQVMCRWSMRTADEFFRPVYEMLCAVVRSDRYQQGDETTLAVIHDGRSARSKSYIWMHCTGAFSEGHPAVVYCFELTRATDHLRSFYGEPATAEMFYLTCDAYGSYQTFEKENEAVCALTGCFMHARRRWVDALAVLGSTGREEISSTNEYKAVSLIGDIYRAEDELKELSAEERFEKRLTTTAPAVDRYFEFIKKLTTEDPLMSERARDAVSYSLNQEKYLRRFLEDGHLSCDNGFSERLIKPVALGRRNWLFNNTIHGAECSCMIYSIAQTAILNKADPYCYFQYLIEQMSGFQKLPAFHALPPDDIRYPGEFLSKLTPWAEEYREYENSKKKCIVDTLGRESSQKPPKAPQKKKELSAS